LLNAVLGVYQESKAEKAIEALQAMSSATSRVLRGGMVRLVKSEELVVGDVVLLEAGDAVPALSCPKNFPFQQPKQRRKQLPPR